MGPLCTTALRRQLNPPARDCLDIAVSLAVAQNRHFVMRTDILLAAAYIAPDVLVDETGRSGLGPSVAQCQRMARSVAQSRPFCFAHPFGMAPILASALSSSAPGRAPSSVREMVAAALARPSAAVVWLLEAGGDL